LQKARDEGGALIGEIVADAASHSLSTIPTATLKAYLDTFSYDFNQDAEAGLKEFVRYGYYHGILRDVPDMKWFGADGDED
jgi:predicted solute-binding protein